MPSWLALRPYVAGAIAALLVAGAVVQARAGGPRETLIAIERPTQSTSMAVFVGGAVVAPGVYTLPTGARVDAAIAAAGGFAPDADPDGVNRALKLRDQAQVIVPRQGAARSPSPAGARSASTAGGSASTANTAGATGAPPAVPASAVRVNVNVAPASELERLPGVGPSLAARIVAYREANGDFRSAADLAKVKGISDRMVEAWAELVTYEP